MLKYRCRILFTTRSRYENQISLEVKELPVDTLLALMSKFYDAGRKIIWLHQWQKLLICRYLFLRFRACRRDANQEPNQVKPDIRRFGELEELRSEKTAILARFDRTEDKKMKEVKTWAKQQEKTVQDPKAKENHCEEE